MSDELLAEIQKTQAAEKAIRKAISTGDEPVSVDIQLTSGETTLRFTIRLNPPMPLPIAQNVLEKSFSNAFWLIFQGESAES